MSVRPSAWNNSATTGRISMKFGIQVFFDRLSRIVQVSLKSDKNAIHEDLDTFVLIFRWNILRIRNISEKVVEKIKTHMLYPITFFRKSCRLWDNVEKYDTAGQGTDDNIIRRMRFACWISKATDTHSEYVIHIAIPRQQWLRERASFLRCTLPVFLTS
jgi:hypothetical protein